MTSTINDPQGPTSDAAGAATPEYPDPFPWGLSVQIVVLGSALLPVVGALVRWVAYRFDDRLYGSLAVAAPVQELVYTGLLAAIPAVVTTAAWVLLVDMIRSRAMRRRAQAEAAMRSFKERFAEVKARHEKAKSLFQRAEELESRLDALPGGTEPDEELAQELSAVAAELPGVRAEEEAVEALLTQLEADQQAIDKLLGIKPQPQRRWRDWRWYRSLLIGVASLAVLILQLVFTTDVVAVLPLLIGAWVALAYLLWAEFARPSRRTLAPAAWALVIVLGCSAVASGLAGAIPDRAVFIPVSSGSLPTGWYSIVGQEDPYMYLLPCQRAAPVVAVRSEDVPTYSFASTPGAATPDVTIWNLVRGRAKLSLGYDSPSCPQP